MHHNEAGDHKKDIHPDRSVTRDRQEQPIWGICAVATATAAAPRRICNGTMEEAISLTSESIAEMRIAPALLLTGPFAGNFLRYFPLWPRLDRFCIFWWMPEATQRTLRLVRRGTLIVRLAGRAIGANYGAGSFPGRASADCGGATLPRGRGDPEAPAQAALVCKPPAADMQIKVFLHQCTSAFQYQATKKPDSPFRIQVENEEGPNGCDSHLS